MAQREQHILPTNPDGTMDNARAPSRWHTQAFGYMGNKKIEYLCTDSTGGMSDESGEMLWQSYVTKTEQIEDDNWGFGYPFETQMQLFINEAGDAYRTWKGKLQGRPVCNFETGVVYYYGKERKFGKD